MIRSWLLILGMIGAAQIHAAVPVTGREQQMVFPRGPVQAAAATAYHQQVEQLAERSELDTEPQLLMHIRTLCSQLIAQAIRLKPDVAGWPWELHITSNPDVAAYSMAGGKLLVGTQFITHYKLNDRELSVALAHEIGHVIAEHVREQVSMAALLNTSVPLRARKAVDVINAMQSDISIFLRLQPLSRLQEMEADDIGIELAARAGIPPSAVISFYGKLAQTGSGQSIFDTHGSVAQRVRFVDSMASYAGPVYEASQHAGSLPGYVFAHAGQ